MQRVLDGMGPYCLAGLEGFSLKEGIERLRPTAGAPTRDDFIIPGPAGPVRARAYRPPGPGPFPTLLFMHGGGWVLGSIEQDDERCRELMRLSGCLIVSVGYRLAPEHKFPAPLEDCYAALQWLVAHGNQIGCDASRLAVGGASAGANLAIGTALLARDRNGPRISCQILIYPICDASLSSLSYRENGDNYYVRRQDLAWFWSQYLRTDSDYRNPYASPVAADLRDLPPALVLTGEFDPLRDEGEDFVARLRAGNIDARAVRYPGVVHGFVSFAPHLQQSRDALMQCATALRLWMDVS